MSADERERVSFAKDGAQIVVYRDAVTPSEWRRAVDLAIQMTVSSAAAPVDEEQAT